jgi:hypothetical protein
MQNIAVISDQFPHVPHGGKGEWGYIQELNHHAEIPEAKEDILDASPAQEGQPISGFYARLMLIVLNAVVFFYSWWRNYDNLALNSGPIYRRGGLLPGINRGWETFRKHW